MKYILIFFLLVSCVKDYDLNPYTTIVRELLKNENGTVPNNNVRSGKSSTTENREQ
jgi:hypothetical protein